MPATTNAGTFGSVDEFAKWVTDNHGTPAFHQRDAVRLPYTENGWAVFEPGPTYRIRTIRGDVFEATIDDSPKVTA